MVILAIWGEVTPGAILTKCCTWTDMVDVINHVCSIWWLSVKGCGCGERGNFALSLWLEVSLLQHWSHYRVTVWWRLAELKQRLLVDWRKLDDHSIVVAVSTWCRRLLVSGLTVDILSTFCGVYTVKCVKLMLIIFEIAVPKIRAFSCILMTLC